MSDTEADLQKEKFTEGLTPLSAQTTLEHLTLEQMLEHPDCPRNWPHWCRILILINICLYNLLGNVFVSGFSSVQGQIAADLKISYTEAGYLSTWGLLTMGLANIWGVGASRWLGRRYTILTSLLGFLACNVWFGVAKTYGSAVGSRILGGLFGGIVESIGPAMIEEVFSPHELARALVLYTVSLAAGGSLGPIISGYVADGTGDWRWFCWVLSITCGFLFVTCTLMLPETSFPVTNDQFDRLIEYWETESSLNGWTNPIEPGHTPSRWEIWRKNSFFLHHKYVHPPRSWARFFLDPLRMLGCPAVLLTSCVFGMSIGWSIAGGINASQHYAMPPLSWKSSSIGLLTAAALVGLLLGGITGGPLADWIMNRPVKNGAADAGESAPAGAFGYSGQPLERRLLAAFVPSLIYPAGPIVLGESLKHYYPWICTALGHGLLGYGFTAACNPFIAYCIDCYPAYAGQLAITISVIKNCVAFGCTYGTVSWMANAGQIEAYGTMSGLLYAMLLFFIPIYIWGKQIRVWSYTWL